MADIKKGQVKKGVIQETPYRLKKQPVLLFRQLAVKIPERPKEWAYTEPVIDIDDIQGDPLLGFNKHHMAVVTIKFVDYEPATITKMKTFLNKCIIPKVSSGRDVMLFRELFRDMRERLGGVKPTSVAQICFNVAFSYVALVHLVPADLPPEDKVEQFYKPGMQEAFSINLKARSTYLHDPKTGIGAAANWKVADPDIMIQIASDKVVLIQSEIDGIQKCLDDLGKPATIFAEYGKRRDDLPGHEHFGFLDGISNLGLRGKYQPSKHASLDKYLYLTPRYLSHQDDRVDLYGLPGQLLVWPGEVILGLPKQYDDTSSGDPDIVNQPGPSTFIGPTWAKNGSFMVYRHLKQDVAKFWKFLTDSAAEIAKEPGMEGMDAHHFGAKVMSRWKSGTPILREPSADNVALGSDRLANNAFQYASTLEPFRIKPSGQTDGFPNCQLDPLGKVCPMAAHLRKVQPRDSSTDIGNKYDTMKRIIIRRGIEYGEPIADVNKDDGVDRGLMFVCYQGQIDKQFEFIVKHWANSKVNPASGGHDMVIGQSDAENRERVFDVPLDGDVTKVKQFTTTEEWVIPTGGGYFFVPSISAIKNIIAKM